MFTKNVGQMSDSELSEFVKWLITTEEPESVYLDYKEALGVTKEPSKKKELAKDISSFANEQGGTVIYGVPEVRDGDLPRPKPLAECGMVIDPDLPGRVENILLSAVQPPLRALVKVVDIQEIQPPKKLLLVYHPESYWKPHMVQGYADGRYYRRGNFRGVPMNQREVEAAYLAREAARRHATDFFETASFGPAHGIQLRAVACPVLPGRFKERMLQPGFRAWLGDNKPMGQDYPRRGEWLPFLEGWRFLAHPEGSISGKQYEVRVFHNGAVCLNLDLQADCVNSNFLMLDRLKRDLRNLFVGYTATVCRQLAIYGPVIVQLVILSANGLEAAADMEDLCTVTERRKALSEGKAIMVGRAPHYSDPHPRSAFLDGDDIVFEEESSTDEILEQPDNILGRLMTRISTAFGLWGDEGE